MKYYLASRYGRRNEMRIYRDMLETKGHAVTSRWIDTNHPLESIGPSAVPPEVRLKHAIEDFEDVGYADAVLNFTEDRDSTAGKRGGRHVEFGIGLCTRKRTSKPLGHGLIIIGERENIFHFLPGVTVYPDFDTFFEGLLHV